jgi:hypothetical protein
VGVAKGEEEIHILAPTLLISKIENTMKQVRTIFKSRGGKVVYSLKTENDNEDGSISFWNLFLCL